MQDWEKELETLSKKYGLTIFALRTGDDANEGATFHEMDVEDPESVGVTAAIFGTLQHMLQNAIAEVEVQISKQDNSSPGAFTRLVMQSTLDRQNIKYKTRFEDGDPAEGGQTTGGGG